MIQRMQVLEFYRTLSAEERTELCRAIAEDIYFLEDELQIEILEILHQAVPEISNKIREINCFTMR